MMSNNLKLYPLTLRVADHLKKSNVLSHYLWDLNPSRWDRMDLNVYVAITGDELFRKLLKPRRNNAVTSFSQLFKKRQEIKRLKLNEPKK